MRLLSKRWGIVSELPVLILVSLLVSLLIKTFIMQAFYIPSQSMEQTLLKNDRVVVNKVGPKLAGVHRGDVVVFKDPGGWLSEQEATFTGFAGTVRRVLVAVGLAPDPATGYLIKRVIGEPGDQVRCCTPSGAIEVNGVSLDEPYIYPGNAPSQLKFDITVPAGFLWVMGDHRENSEDSRYHQDDSRKGMVPRGDVVGRAAVLIWPMKRATLLTNPWR